MKLLKLCLFFTSFLFLTGFVHLPAVLGPAITAATSGNLAKATAQLVFDNEYKENQINEDFKNLIEKRVKTVHQKLVDQNNEPKIIKDFKLLVEKRVKFTHKKLMQQKINQ